MGKYGDWKEGEPDGVIPPFSANAPAYVNSRGALVPATQRIPAEILPAAAERGDGIVIVNFGTVIINNNRR